MPEMKIEPPLGGISKFQFHMGETLLATAKTYPSLFLAVLEYIQNSLDKKADRITIVVDKSKRTIVTTDNGEGAAQEEMERAFTSVNKSIKVVSESLGKYGRGIAAGVGKCARVLVTTTPKNDPHNYKTWTLDSEKLMSQHTIEGIPWHPRPDLWYGGGEGKVPWRTEIRLEEYYPDRFLSEITFEQLRDETISRYGIVMRRNKVVVTIRITEENKDRKSWTFEAPPYAGTPLGEEIIRRDMGDRAIVRLYIARTDKKNASNGKVCVGMYGDDFRIRWETFLRSLPPSFREQFKAAADALSSGYFEGEIIGDCQLTMDAERTSYRPDQHLDCFCKLIGEWFEKIGSEYYEDIREAREESRLQECNRKVIDMIEEMLKREEGSFLRDVLNDLRVSRRGRGPKTATSLADLPTLLEDSLEVERKKKEAAEREKEEKEGKKPRIKRGERRVKREPKETRSETLGISICHDMLRDTKLYEFDRLQAKLTLNITNRLWEMCKRRGEATEMKFRKLVVIQAFVVEAAPVDVRETVRAAMENMAVGMAYVYANESPIGKKKKTEEKIESLDI